MSDNNNQISPVDNQQQSNAQPQKKDPRQFAATFFQQQPQLQQQKQQSSTLESKTTNFDDIVIPTLPSPTPDRPNRVGVDNRARDYFASILNQSPEETQAMLDKHREQESTDTLKALKWSASTGLFAVSSIFAKDMALFLINKKRGRLPPQIQHLSTFQYIISSAPFQAGRFLATSIALFATTEGLYRVIGKPIWDNPTAQAVVWGTGAFAFTIIRPQGSWRFYTPFWTSVWALMGANYAIYCGITSTDPLAPQYIGKRRKHAFNVNELKINNNTLAAQNIPVTADVATSQLDSVSSSLSNRTNNTTQDV